jgi:hypothetical protein
VVTRLDKTMATMAEKSQSAKITHVVSVIESGQVPEIHPTPIPDGELYFVRLTAEKSGTKMELLSALSTIKRLKRALSSCSDLQPGPEQKADESKDKQRQKKS